MPVYPGALSARRAPSGRRAGQTGHGEHLHAVSQRIRKRVEEIFGWAKTVAGMRKARYRGQRRVGLQMHFVAAAYNLVRMAKLMPMTS